MRQAFELPPIKLRVTEYRAAHKRCPHCERVFTAEFPAGVKAPTQYGPGMQAVMTYLQAWQLLPHERSAQVCEDFFGHRPSSGKRGLEGLSAAGVLPQYRGKLMHDFCEPHDKLEHCEHLRCNAHLLRELKACAEDGHKWAEELAATLLAMKHARDEALAEKEPQVSRRRCKELEARYDQWISQGLREHPTVEKACVRQGRAKQSTENSLLMRLRDKKDEVTAFLREIEPPFDNNQAERDLRMMKVQQKVSGCLRSEAGAKAFCVIRSHLASARKQGINIIDSIRNAVLGYPHAFSTGAE